MTLPAISIVGEEHANQAAEVIAAAFSNSPFTGYLLRNADSTWPSNQIPSEIILPHFQESTPKKLKYGAELVEAGNWAAVAVWFPPGRSIPIEDNPDPRVKEYRDTFAQIKKQHLRGREYWYLNLIGRHPNRTDAGAVRALIDPYLKKAREQGAAVWLEAITEHGKQVYEHLSFRTVAEVRIGVGKTNSKGEFDENGEGILVYGMMAE
ncbi:hypothetical protein DTO166G4_8228 [Paecilomyces variotii]|nr:hypothetical protein DTO166G4_8228 [Paecilomyces variotii]KAJ9230518.1 hypothetical protein DTO166G5_7298 [Paecilomyces variotii]KAJ9264753.1 hypothetical protein DTO195F2_2204 [Paecilomyces variotii]KAJ9350417.1 hypothetical protein DTO027B9_6965 [Paecilomyces variotii]KAJ9380442.1 hypothetical protein DTO063F5_6639 [Paecilomyces variotii]